MAHNHRTTPPRTGSWEVCNFKPWDSQQWISRTYPPRVLKQISLRLRDALLTQDITTFLRSKYHQSQADDGWRCWRYLGGGGFGAAAVWKEFNQDGDLLDEMVIKQWKEGKDAQVGNSKYIFHHPALEAQTQSILNLSQSDNLIHLRGYKVIASNLPTVLPIVRFYLEYAPYGDLSNLTTRYQAFSRYLPELFLWHLFNSLARTAQVLDRDPEARPGKQEFVIHLDIKPENIFLGYETAKNRGDPITGGLHGERYEYPTVKLGDFGLAVRTVNYGKRPILDLHDTGTEGYRPPEQEQQYGHDWAVPPNRLTDHYTTKLNIWAIGKVMYDTFSLSTRFDYFQNKHCAQSRRQYDEYGQSPLPDYLSAPFHRDGLLAESPYSSKLSDLIERCMHVEPSRRPTPDELYQETKAAMQEQEQKPESNSDFSVRHRKLYYVGNSINDMPYTARNCHIPIEPEDYFSLLEPGNNDPDEPSLDIYKRQLWDFQADLAKRDRLRARAEYWQARHAEGLQWRTELYAAGERVRITPHHIEFPDPDNHLTYEPDGNDGGNGGGGGGKGGKNGSARGGGKDGGAGDGNDGGRRKDLAGGKKSGNRRDKDDQGHGDGDRSTHKDNNNNEKNDNIEGPGNGRTGKGGSQVGKARARDHGKYSIGDSLQSISMARQSTLDRPKRGKQKSIGHFYRLDEKSSQPPPRKLFEPYVFHNAHEETFERASINGPGLEYVINVDPDPKIAARIAQMDKSTSQTTEEEAQALTQNVCVGTQQQQYAGYRSPNRISSSSEGGSRRRNERCTGSSGKRPREASGEDHTAMESSNRSKRSKTHASKTLSQLAADTLVEMAKQG